MSLREPIETDQDWADREVYWQTKLRRLRFGAEPLRVQVERYRLVTVAMTVVASVMAMIFVFIFTAFRRPDIAGIIIGGFFLPIIGLAWLDFLSLQSRFGAYEAERKKKPKPIPPLAPGEGRGEGSSLTG